MAIDWLQAKLRGRLVVAGNPVFASIVVLQHVSGELWQRVQPSSTGGVYANNLGEEGEDRVKAAFGENYPRLVALKTKYDPTNLLRINQNIWPPVLFSPLHWNRALNLPPNGER